MPTRPERRALVVSARRVLALAFASSLLVTPLAQSNPRASDVPSRQCIQSAHGTPAERAETLADCATRFAALDPANSAALAYLAADAYVRAGAWAAAVRWALRCDALSERQANDRTRERLRSECRTIVRDHLRDVAWVRNDDPRCRWSLIEDTFGDASAVIRVAFNADERWVAVRAASTEASVECDPPAESPRAQRAQRALRVTLEPARRYRFSLAVSVREE
jgi:hypothetical protein